MLEFLYELVERYWELFLALTAFSLVTVVAMATLGAAMVSELPADYFINAEHRKQRVYLQHLPTPVRMVAVFGKNITGIVLIVAGILMLVLPGQGLLTMLAGIMLTDLPGKYTTLRWLVQHKTLTITINWLRARKGVGPLEL